MILVVGGGGYIGSHFCRLLAEVGEPFAVFDNFERGHRVAVKGCEVFEGDLRESDSVRRALAVRKFEAVVHFAAYIEVGESVQKPDAYHLNNVVGTQNLLNEMRPAEVGRIVFSSTAAVYGEPDLCPIPETHPCRPTSPYGETKLKVEQALAEAEADNGLRSIVYRYFNAAGAHPSGEIGEDHRPESHLVPRVLQSMSEGRCVTIYGDDYDTEDGTCVRDYVHVCDLAQAHLLAVRNLRSGAGSRVFNLGSGTGHSVREVIDTAAKVTGVSPEVKVETRRPGDASRLVASNQRAKDDLGWTPERADLTTIIEDAWRWHRLHPGGFLESER